MKFKPKQLLACFVAAMMMIGTFTVGTAANAADDIRVILDGVELEFDVSPQIVDERTMVPMRAIFEALGATVGWDDETRTVTAVRGETTVVMQVGNYTMFVNDNEIVLDVAPLIEDGRTLVPARAVAEGLDADVQWNGVTRIVTITSTAEEVEETIESVDENVVAQIDAGLVGTWIWMGIIPYYVFNADGTGERNGRPISWTSANGILSICITPDDCGAVCILPLEWYYVLDGNNLTLTSVVLDTIVFEYTRR